MANLNDKSNFQVSIPIVEMLDKVNHYSIVIQLGSCSWNTTHRYSEFADLHELLVTHHGLARDLLPPKKIIGNKDPAFVEKRRKDLELYLQTVVGFMSAALPEQLAEFLELKHYEMNFLLQDLARFYFRGGDLLLQHNEPAVFNPLQLMAISKQMQSSNPVLFAYGKENDFTNIVDFCSNVKRVVIQGSSQPYKSSNIIINGLPYNLNVFKNVEELTITASCLFKIEMVGPVRKSVKKLIVRNCDIKEICDILICDSLHREVEEGNSDNVWLSLEDLDLSSNNILNVDRSVALTPKLKHLNISANKLTTISSYLTKLPQLVHLNLSSNHFHQLCDLHTKFGNIKILDLSQNCLTNLECLAKLYSVVYLNLASNQITEVLQVETICHLPCLEELILTGNPVATTIDYRTKVLELFGKRACEICLDNERPTQKELDKVAVLQALKSAREGRLPNLSLSHPLPSDSVPLLLERPDVGTIAKE